MDVPVSIRLIEHMESKRFSSLLPDAVGTFANAVRIMQVQFDSTATGAATQASFCHIQAYKQWISLCSGPADGPCKGQ